METNLEARQTRNREFDFVVCLEGMLTLDIWEKRQ